MSEYSVWKVSDDGFTTFTEDPLFAEWCEIRGWMVSIVSYEVDQDE
ncbi:hypothetical protein [Halostagnicola kamekurae]|uniref:Uncharacterized protein n=1 Tax=Halostagnicola kamekurae TaxID=619731 RepID=A0A1I6UYL8_9EURY|nr:hypothetical protein [Halostagnicola kamekurae]SFT06417.1 hypothetical protein SAMN04488556_4172 [Halostagnicola kamekurae]